MKPQERKVALVKAAVKCFAKHGYHATQISDIIKEAKIARGTFYLYFKSKHEIFQFILDDFIKHLSSQIKLIELGKGLSPAMQMRQNAERVVDAVLAQPALGKIIFNEAVGLDKTIDKRLSIFYKRLLEIIGSSIKRGISLGLTRHVDARVASCIILGGVREILVQNMIFKNTSISRDAMVDGLIDVILGGLGGRPMLA